MSGPRQDDHSAKSRIEDLAFPQQVSVLNEVFNGILYFRPESQDGSPLSPEEAKQLRIEQIKKLTEIALDSLEHK